MTLFCVADYEKMLKALINRRWYFSDKNLYNPVFLLYISILFPSLMRVALVILFCFIFPSRVEKIKNPYLSLKFDKVVMYDFSGGKDWNQYIVDAKGHLATSITKQAVIDNKIVTELNKRLGDKKSFGAGEAACFDPHLGFVYYLQNKIVAHITVCLDCNVLASSLPLDAQKQGKVGEGKDAYYMAGGPSAALRSYLNGLLKKYNFSHQLRN